MGQQAVVYSASVLDAFYDFFEECERTMTTSLRLASKKTKSDESGVSASSDVPAGDLCIEVSDNFNRRFVASMARTMSIFTTTDSLVQHIGKVSAIQMGNDAVNQLFHYNLELGIVSEDYSNNAVRNTRIVRVT